MYIEGAGDNVTSMLYVYLLKETIGLTHDGGESKTLNMVLTIALVKTKTKW